MTSEELEKLTDEELMAELQELKIKRKRLINEIDALEDIMVGINEQFRKRQVEKQERYN